MTPYKRSSLSSSSLYLESLDRTRFARYWSELCKIRNLWMRWSKDLYVLSFFEIRKVQDRQLLLSGGERFGFLFCRGLVGVVNSVCLDKQYTVVIEIVFKVLRTRWILCALCFISVSTHFTNKLLGLLLRYRRVEGNVLLVFVLFCCFAAQPSLHYFVRTSVTVCNTVYWILSNAGTTIVSMCVDPGFLY